MSDKSKNDRGFLAEEIFDLAGSNPELLRSGRIPDPQPEHTALFRWLARILGTLEEFMRGRGGVSLRMVIRLFWGLVAAIGLFLLVGPIINKPMDLDEVIASAKFEDIDWVAQDAAFDYDVQRADDRTFEMTATESYTANFVNGDEQRVARSFITELHGHDTEFELVSATIDGEPADVTVRDRATTSEVELRLANGDMLSGKQVIEVEYKLNHLIKDVTATDAPVDEWRWPVFGPSWTQGTAGLEVSVTLPRELNDAMTRKPYATVGWLLVSGNVWLEPDEETSEWVRYSFTNSDNLPPNSSAMMRFTFADGTFEQPPTTALFWVFTWGPLIPLALLVVVMFFALAARRIVWADSAGEPWFAARSDPPDGLPPSAAAELLRKQRHSELVDVLAEATWTTEAARKGTQVVPRRTMWDSSQRGRQRRADWMQRVAEAARRAGRAGSIPSVSAQARKWAAAKSAVKLGLRWVPDSYVRDTFILAPIAVTLVQWGILRQLTEQYILLIVWWPFAIVASSSIIGLVALWAVTRRYPLTREGALAVQQLKGIDVYARGTRLLERGTLDDRLLPYAILFEDPRKAGDAVHALAVQESRDTDIARGWRTTHFLSASSILGCIAAVAALAASIVLAVTAPIPYGPQKHLTWPSSSESGAIWSQVEGFDIEAELSRDSDGAARIEAVERFTVGFVAGGRSVPQFEREWTSVRHGQDLGLEISSVKIDGEEVPFAVVEGVATTKVSTRLADVIEGKLPVEVRYSLTSPAVEVKNGGTAIQQVRWAAMLHFWDDTFYTNQRNPFDGSAPVRPIRVQFTVAPDLVNEVRLGGWISYDRDADRVPYEQGAGIEEWVYESSIYIYDETKEFGDPGYAENYEIIIGDETVRSDGAHVYTLDVDEVQSRWVDRGDYGAVPGPYPVDPEVNETLGQFELDLGNDFGATLNFDVGTFSNVAEGSYTKHRVNYLLPLVITISGTVLVLAAAAVAFVFGRRQTGPLSASARLTVFGTVTILAVAQSVMFWWAVGSMSGDSAVIPVTIVLSLAMWGAVIAEWIVNARAPKTLKATALPKK